MEQNISLCIGGQRDAFPGNEERGFSTENITARESTSVPQYNLNFYSDFKMPEIIFFVPSQGWCDVGEKYPSIWIR